jgi:GTP-binding protein
MQSKHDSDSYFLKGATGTASLPQDNIPHIVFAGRSNVGKSSTINSLIGSRQARSSSTPGKTREMNFYTWSIFRDEEYIPLYIIDLPGYGYAKLSLKERDKMLKRTLHYLEEFQGYIRVLILIIDAQVGITAFDEEFMSLVPSTIPIFVLANKSDKLTQKQVISLQKSLATYNVRSQLFSAKTGKFNSITKNGIAEYFKKMTTLKTE